MARVVKIKNATASDGTWVGQLILAGETFEIPAKRITAWASSSDAMIGVANGDLIVNNGVADLNAVDGWNWILGDTMPISEHGTKVWVHESSKPEKPGKQYFIVWSGAGDDYQNNEIGGGQQLIVETETGVAETYTDIFFDTPDGGDVYLHEGYFLWKDAGWGDALSVDVMCSATELQTLANLDYEMDGNRLKYAAGGAGTGTHGFASADVYLVPNRNKLGYWDYDETASPSLTPSLDGTGQYDIYDIDQTVNRFINRLPVFGSSSNYTMLQSGDAAYMPPGYYLRITAHNVSNTVWKALMIMTLFRERTV